jgi:hypothetical protein
MSPIVFATIVSVVAHRPVAGVDVNLRILEEAEAFVGASPGRAAGPPAEAVAFRSVSRRPGAPQAFLSLARAGSPATRLYGLCGVKQLGLPELGSLKDELRKTNASVEMGDGCMRSTKTMQDAVPTSNSGSLFDSICESLVRYSLKGKENRTTRR